MTNLDAKQEAIKKAYGEHWERLNNFINEDGVFIGDTDMISDELFNEWAFIGSSKDINSEKLISGSRPKSLKGIENNNGWMRIESEADLPKEGMHHSILLDSECINGYRNYDVIVFYEVNSKFRKKEISHYQPIEIPKTPIY